MHIGSLVEDKIFELELFDFLKTIYVFIDFSEKNKN